MRIKLKLYGLMQCVILKKMCKEYNLDWEQKPLKILGVTIGEVFDIWNHNLDETLHKVNSLINVWFKRRLTLPGKITVIKSLILSKFTHLFLALPNPPGEFLKLIERKLYTFLWRSNGPDRIYRRKIVKNIHAGGLRMVNVNEFITSLKVTWLRRFIIFSDNDKWSYLSRIILNNIFSLGDIHSKTVIKDLRNPFFEKCFGELG